MSNRSEYDANRWLRDYLREDDDEPAPELELVDDEPKGHDPRNHRGANA